MDQFDSTSLAALSAGSYAATETIASMVQESTFSSVYQQGETHSILVLNVDEHCLLTVIFPARISVGAVKPLEVFAGFPWSEARSHQAEELPYSEGWTTFSLDLRPALDP